MNQEPKLSADLWGTLTQIFALGFVDEMKGSAATDEDEIDSVTAREIEAAAMAYLGEETEMIHDLYPENPQKVYDVVYHAGCKAHQEMVISWLRRN